MPEVQFHSKIAALAPAEIEFKPVVFVIDEGQIGDPAPRDGKVPAAIWISNLVRINSRPHGFLVGDADHVIAEIFKRVPHVPHEVPAGAIRTIPGRSVRFVNIPKPPDRIQLVVEVDRGKIGPRHHDHAVPVGPGRPG